MLTALGSEGHGATLGQNTAHSRTHQPTEVGHRLEELIYEAVRLVTNPGLINCVRPCGPKWSRFTSYAVQRASRAVPISQDSEERCSQVGETSRARLFLYVEGEGSRRRRAARPAPRAPPGRPFLCLRRAGPAFPRERLPPEEFLITFLDLRPIYGTIKY